jgi:hypothetical protein
MRELGNGSEHGAVQEDGRERRTNCEDGETGGRLSVVDDGTSQMMDVSAANRAA